MEHAGALQASASDEWNRSYDLAPGGEFQIVASRGSVDIQGGAGERVVVTAERVARAATESTAKDVLPRIRIREDISPEKIVLQTEGLAGITIGVEVEVNYRVTLPATSRVRVRATNGGVTIADVEGQVVASSANGEIVGRRLGGGVEARVVNKNLMIDLAAFGRSPVDLRATNGSVDIAVPADANANLLANVTNGSVDVKDLAFEVLGDQTPRRVRGRLNAGGTPIEATAVNGNIRVHSRQ